MIRLPKRILFSIKAVLAIACHTGGSPVRSIDITEREAAIAQLEEQARSIALDDASPQTAVDDVRDLDAR